MERGERGRKLDKRPKMNGWMVDKNAGVTSWLLSQRGVQRYKTIARSFKTLFAQSVRRSKKKQ